MRRASAALLGLMLCVPATRGPAQDFDPATLDLAALIECRADVPAYNGFAFWLTGEPGAPETLDWREAASDNPFLKEYVLPAPLGVFGRQTASIAFTATGPMAVLEDVAAKDLAAELGMPASLDAGGKFLGEKIVFEETEEADGMTFATRISLNVSTVESHPGKTLAGCSYSIEMKEAV